MDLVYDGGFTVEIETDINVHTGISQLAIPMILRIQITKLTGKVII